MCWRQLMRLRSARTWRLSHTLGRKSVLVQRAWQIVFVAWMVGLGAWYTITAAQNVLRPLNSGFDLVWGCLWLGVVVLVGISHWTWRKAGVTRLWLTGIAVIACLMFILSGQLLAVIVCTWLLVVAWACGAWLLGYLGADRISGDLEEGAIAVALGFGMLALMTMGLALIGGLYPAVAWAMMLGLTLLHLRSIYHGLTGLAHRILGARRSPGKSESLEWVEQRVLVILAGYIFLGNLVWALTPEIQFDALNYHLAVPKIYIQHHRLVDLPYFFHSYFAHLVDMLYTLALLLNGLHVAKLLMLAVGVLVAMALYSFGRLYSSPRVGLWAAALFYTTPLVSWLSSTTYIDLAVALFLFTAVASLIRWEANRDHRWLVVSGLLAGEALGAKLTAVFGLFPLSLVLLWRLLAHWEPSPLARLTHFGGFVLSVGLMAFPWFVVIWALTGNPVFPFFNAIFKSPGWALENTTLDSHEYGIGISLASLARLPFSLTYDTGRFGGMIAGALGASLLMALPMGIIWMRERRLATQILLGWSFGYIVLWALVAQYSRYFIPLLPAVVLLAASTVRVLSSPVSWMRWPVFVSFGMVLVAQGVMIPPQFWNIPERFPIRLVLGLETPDAFLSRVLPAYEAVDYLNRVTNPSADKVIGIGGSEGIRFYLDVPLESVTESPYMWLVAASLAPGRGLATALTRHGSTYLLDSWRDRPAWEFLDLPYRNPRFLDTYATLAFEGRNASVYRLVAPESAQNLLDNASFEDIDSGGIPLGWFASGRPVIDPSGQHARTGSVGVQVGPTTFLYQHVLVEPSGAYTLGHWTRADRPDQPIRLQIHWLDNHLQLIDASIAVVSAGSLWAWHQMSVKAPERAAIAQIYASVHTDGEVWFDDLWFAQGGSVPQTP